MRVEVLRGTRWRLLAQLTTDASGAWSTPVLPRKTRLLRATYSGDAVWRRSFSPEQLLRLKPLVALAPGATHRRARAAGAARGHGHAAQAAASTRCSSSASAASYRQVGVKTVRVRAGRFRSSFVPAFAARYRVYVLARADADHVAPLALRGRAEPIAGARSSHPCFSDSE